MNSRRGFLLSLPLLTGGVASAQTKSQLNLNGNDSAKTIQELKKSLFLGTKWKESEFAKRKFIFALTEQGDGESYIDLHGWIYNQSFKEWRRILNIKTRGIGNAEIVVDEQKGILSLRGAANNDLKDVEVLRFDLRATNDDSGYLR